MMVMHSELYLQPELLSTGLQCTPSRVHLHFLNVCRMLALHKLCIQCLVTQLSGAFKQPTPQRTDDCITQP